MSYTEDSRRKCSSDFAASAAAGPGCGPDSLTGTLGATLAPSTSINFLLLIGAIAFGLGALINDTCLLGSLARQGMGRCDF